jgi:hypothetical protein
MEVIGMKLSSKEKRRQYRIIYESLYEDARITITDLSKKMGASLETTSKRVNEAFDEGYLLKSQIRKRSYANIKQYMFFVDCEDPLESYLRYLEDEQVVYHAVMEGFSNLWVTSLDKMIIEGNILVGGPVSDMHVSFAPPHSWGEAKKIMWKKVEAFDPTDYESRGTIQTHFDKEMEWEEEDEVLYKNLKYDLRKPLYPIARKNHISGQRAWDWLEKLPECCSIMTPYYPQTRSAYNSYIFVFETEYEDFIIDVFSELPSSCVFFKVSNKLVLHAHVVRELLRSNSQPVSNISRLHIPLLTKYLLEKGIIKKERHALVDYYWRKDI